MASSTLQTIRTKVRRLTRSMSPSQLTDADIDQYINTFVLYDFPEHLRLFNLKANISFITEPFISTYTSSTTPGNQLFNFKNSIISVEPPIYIAGRQALFMESREQFFSIYPKVASIASIGTTGNGVTQTFTGTISTAQAQIPPFIQGTPGGVVLLAENVLFDSIGINNTALAMIDFPISGTIGNLYVPGGVPTSTTIQDPLNYVNYTTGQFVVTFIVPPATGSYINSQSVPSQTALPQAFLFFDGYIELRPVPDQSYKVEMEVFLQPAELLDASQNPDLNEWWQVFAYGAAKKVLEDRMDLETVQQILPEYTKQMALINRRTIVQQTSQRTSTIYSGDSGGIGASGNGSFGGNSIF